MNSLYAEEEHRLTVVFIPQPSWEQKTFGLRSVQARTQTWYTVGSGGAQKTTGGSTVASG